MVCELERSLYGLKQVWRTWGSLLLEHLTAWVFIPITTDPRVPMAKIGQEFIIVLIVVYDMMFITNPQPMFDVLKKKISPDFEVIFFGKSTNFIGWEIRIKRSGIEIGQQTYIQSLLKKYKVGTCNATLTPLATAASVFPSQPNEKALDSMNHAPYRRQIG